MEAYDRRKEDEICMLKVEGSCHDLVRSCAKRQNKKRKSQNKDPG